jgi:RecB family exonuclease
VITPRRTRLVRVPHLRSFRAAIHARITAGGPSTVVVVPTQAAARQLASRSGPARIVTRDELYEHLHGRLAAPPRRLTTLERDAIGQSAARAAAGLTGVTFRLRPGLVAEMLRFHDQLRRQSLSVARSGAPDGSPYADRQVRRFRELILNSLGGDELDRGTRRLRQQTEFLAAAFAEYDRRVRASGALDEHLLRERLIAEPSPNPVRTIVVTIGDWIAEPDGLFAADFDLLARLPGLETLDVVATERLLASGFHERLHSWLPGIEEVAPPLQHRDGERGPERSALRDAPLLIVPSGAPPDTLWWTFRDREEELCAIARHVREDRRQGDAVALDRIAVVFKKPLPYLYLADEVFGSARIPHQTFDALPLAAQPAAAALDLILDAADANFTRDTLIALLRSPHFVWPGTEACESRSIRALDRALSRARYLGDRARLLELGARRLGKEAAPAYRNALAVTSELCGLRDPGSASAKLHQLRAVWERNVRPSRAADDGTRASAAIAETLRALAEAHAAHHDPEWTLDDLSLAVRRAVEEQTFERVEDRADHGVHLLDDRAARYGDFDTVFIVGVIEAEWPERPRRNIFYPPSLLKALGWPSEQDRRSAADASFLDLASGADRRTLISVFTLEDDALTTRSMQIDELPRARLSAAVRGAPATPARIFYDQALMLDPIAWGRLGREARAWARVRANRTGAGDPRFHGSVAPASQRAWSVSALETYIGCPFRFFARYVLDLEEDPTDEEVMDPRRQGQFVHEVFERFFAEWQRQGHGAITRTNLGTARAVFAEVIEESLAALPEAEAGLERTRLLGSPAAVGLGEAVMRMEAERPVKVLERLLEHPLEGDFTIQTVGGPRVVTLKGKADRIDLLADGTFRLIDYKLGWPPDRRKALQLPIYSLCAEQRLHLHAGRRWQLGEAVYLAFKGPRRVVPLFQEPAERERVIGEAQQRLSDTLDAIAAGRFPPTPDDVFRCETCSYAAVCRKDYVGDV